MKKLATAIVQGAAAGNASNVASSRTVQVRTVVTSVPPNRYGQGGRKR